MCRSRKWHPVEPVEARRGEQPQRVPPRSPGVADPLVGVEDDEAETSPGEMVAGRQAGLSATDDYGLDPLGIAHGVHPSHLPWSGLLGRDAMRGACSVR